LRLLWYSNAPWTSSAYGQQTALFVPLIRALGHEVVICAFNGLCGGTLRWKDDITVLPCATVGDPYGVQMLAAHVREQRTDLVITLTDIWVMEPSALKGLPVAHWMPVDCDPLSAMDAACLEVSQAVPVTMSRFGERVLREAGAQPLYVPHGIHEAFLDPGERREAARERMGTGDRFAIGINAANKDAFRKGMAEQFSAFARLHAEHPDTVLMMHGLPREAEALDLDALAANLGIGDAIRYTDPYAYQAGQVGVDYLADWYAALDLYSGCSLAEGFGLPIVEAQAAGVPVVVTDAASMPELCGGGWTVASEPFWNPAHNSWWAKPLTGEIHRVYEEAYQRGPQYQAARAKARDLARQYEAGLVARQWWKPALEALEAGLP